jgi:DNA polymerase-3 subunit delta
MSTPRPGFSILVCPDGQLLRARLERLLAAHPPRAGQWERRVYWGDEEPPAAFWEELTLPGLLGTSRALVVRQAQLWPVAVWKKLSRALARPSEQCWPCLCVEVPGVKGPPKLPAALAKLHCLKFAAAQDWLWRHEGLTPYSLKSHLVQRGKALGLRFAPDALERLCASVPPDARAVENELEKILLLRASLTAQGAPLPPEVDLSQIPTGGWSPDCNIFSCIRHMEAGNLAPLWQELARNEDGASLLFSFLALLDRELRQLWQLKAGENIRLYPKEAAAKRALAARLSAETLAAALAEIVDAEWQVKSGRRSPEQSLDFLAARITGLLAPAGAPR